MRYPEGVCLYKDNSLNFIRELVQLFSRVGLPKEILTDQDTAFMSKLMCYVCHLLHRSIKKSFVSAHTEHRRPTIVPLILRRTELQGIIKESISSWSSRIIAVQSLMCKSDYVTTSGN